MIGTAINKYGKKEKNKKIKEGPCIFPFKYQWKTNNNCVDTPKGEICATTVNDKQTLQTYGYCEDKELNKSIDNLEQSIGNIQGTPILTNLLQNEEKTKTSNSNNSSPKKMTSSKSKSPQSTKKSPSLKSKSPEPLKVKSISKKTSSKSASPKELTKVNLSPKNSLNSSTKKKNTKTRVKKNI